MVMYYVGNIQSLVHNNIYGRHLSRDFYGKFWKTIAAINLSQVKSDAKAVMQG